MTLHVCLDQAAIASAETAMASADRHRLLAGEILLKTAAHTAWGSAVTARMYLSEPLEAVWQQVRHYPRWVEFFPDLVSSEVLCPGSGDRPTHRIRQAARKQFLLLTAQVEVYLRVTERSLAPGLRQIDFELEKGSFKDFSALLTLREYGFGTLLTYTVQATPLIPIPAPLIQEAIRLDLPNNMRQMRRVLTRSAA